MQTENVKATVHYAGNEMFIGISPSGHAQVMDMNHERRAGATPIELLMIAVGGCTAIDVISILQKKRQQITDYRVEVRGERRDEHPRSFTKFYVHHVVRGRNVSADAVAHAVSLSDSTYCSVVASVKPAAEVITSFEVIEEV